MQIKNWKVLANTKPRRTNVPELEVLANSGSGKGKIRINEAASELLDVAPGQYLTILVDDEDKNNVLYAIMKVEEDIDGAQMKMGLGNPSSKAEGVGHILQGVNANFHFLLNGNDTCHKVYTINSESETDGDGTELGIYMLTYDRDKDKIERSNSSSTSDEDEDVTED